MPLATITINAPSVALDKQHQEVQLIDRALRLATMDIRSNGGKKSSGNIVDAGVTLGTWTYSRSRFKLKGCPHENDPNSATAETCRKADQVISSAGARSTADGLSQTFQRSRGPRGPRRSARLSQVINPTQENTP